MKGGWASEELKSIISVSKQVVLLRIATHRVT